MITAKNWMKFHLIIILNNLKRRSYKIKNEIIVVVLDFYVL